MACYNSAPYLDHMLESILAQTYDNIELITVNGSSSDNTSEKLRSWVQAFKDRGYGMLNIEKPGSSLNDAVNEGFRHFTGDFVCIIDSDDYVSPEYTWALVRCLEDAPACGWAKCDAAVLIDDTMGQLISKNANRVSKPYITDDMIRFIARLDYLDGWTIMMRADYLKRCLPDLRLPDAVSHEIALIALLSANGSYAHIPRVLYYNLRHKGSGHDRYYSAIESAISSLDSCIYSFNKSLSYVDMEKDKRERYETAFSFRFLKKKFFLAHRLGHCDICDPFIKDLLLSLINNINMSAPENTLDNNSAFYCAPIACAALINIILSIPLSCSEDDLASIKEKGFIIYGAGSYCKFILPALKALDLEPIEIWDKSAAAGDSLNGYPLINPSDARPHSPILIMLSYDLTEDILRNQLRTIPRDAVYTTDEAESILIAAFVKKYMPDKAAELTYVGKERRQPAVN
jgi:glycosyltransferase involved in cell wall biosynthesis